MSTNPYASNVPTPAAPQPGGSVSAPAIALIVVAAISLLFLVLALFADLFLLFSGLAAELPQDGPVDRETTILIRGFWTLLMVTNSGYVLYAAIAMSKRSNYQTARRGAIAACIPCFGPCFLLGIPFGIWALVVLNDPQTRAAFRS